MRLSCPCGRMRVAILYSSSQNSLRDTELSEPSSRWRCRNPLFIKSEFSPPKKWLISSLQTDDGRSQSFIHQVRILSSSFSKFAGRRFLSVAILYSSSQNSLSRGRWARPRPAAGVAILYSSSQNSLLKIHITIIHTEGVPSQSFIHQVRILSPDRIRGFKKRLGTGSQSFIHQVRILSMRIKFSMVSVTEP